MSGLAGHWLYRGCHLNEDSCLSLRQVLGAFGAPISEAWAWALAHESARTVVGAVASKTTKTEGATTAVRLFLVKDTAELMLHSSGEIHPSSFTGPGPHRTPFTSQVKALCELGLVIYACLDFGLGASEQRSLSPELEKLLERMTEANNDTDDEGIACDDEELRRTDKNFAKTIMEECASQLSVPNEALTHYRAVCRAMVSEALELSTFMEKVAQCDEERAEELRELDMQDWARLWVSCMRDLRHGVKLKKTNYTKTPVEYELTPYEILMDDIRSKRYKLRKVMVDGEIPPKVKKDAHEVILEFIRSRPPLKPAFHRELRPLNKQSTPVEQLMESIRNSSIRSSLRKTSGPPPRPGVSFLFESSRTGIEVSEDASLSGHSPSVVEKALPKRLEIRPAEERTMLDFEADLTDAEETDAESITSGGGGLLSRQTSTDSRAEDLVDRRRHSVSVCETPQRRKPDSIGRQRKIYVTASSTSSSSAATSGSATPTSGRATPVADLQRGYSINTPQMHASLQSELLKSGGSFLPGPESSPRMHPPAGEETSLLCEAQKSPVEATLPGGDRITLQVPPSTRMTSSPPTRRVQKQPRLPIPEIRIWSPGSSDESDASGDDDLACGETDHRPYPIFEVRHLNQGERPKSTLDLESMPLEEQYHSCVETLGFDEVVTPDRDKLEDHYHSCEETETSDQTSPDSDQDNRSVDQSDVTVTNNDIGEEALHNDEEVGNTTVEAPLDSDYTIDIRPVRMFLAPTGPLEDIPEEPEMSKTAEIREMWRHLTHEQEREVTDCLENLLSLMTPKVAREGDQGRHLCHLPSIRDWTDDHWSTALKTLDLTLDEVVHIRSVLTKAELEGLPLDGTLKEDVERGKICFLCMKTRFSLFTWGVRCQLCNQQVCAKCSTKIRIPVEYFSSIPPSALSTSRSGNAGGWDASSPMGSAPSSPRRSQSRSRRNRGRSPRRRRASSDDRSIDRGGVEDAKGPVSLPVDVGRGDGKSKKKSKDPSAKLQVCSDCHEMILQVVRAQTTTKRFQIARTIFEAGQYAKEEVFTV